MASQIAHIIYAKRYFDFLEFGKSDGVENEKILIPPKDLDKDQFLLGCVFPDIRYIDAGIERKDTHLLFEKVDLDFSNLNSFEAGWKFHLYCDMRREDILNGFGFYSSDEAKESLYIFSAKFLEDELVHDSYNNWEKIINLFRNPPIIGTGINVSRETFTLWYAILAKYFEEKPNNKSMRIFLSKLLKINGDAGQVIEQIEILRKDKKAVETISNISNKILK